MLKTERELALLAHENSEKLWARLAVRMTGTMRDEVRRLATLDYRSLEDQMRWLIEIGIREEKRRLGINSNGNGHSVSQTEGAARSHARERTQ